MSFLAYSRSSLNVYVHEINPLLAAPTAPGNHQRTGGALEDIVIFRTHLILSWCTNTTAQEASTPVIMSSVPHRNHSSPALVVWQAAQNRENITQPAKNKLPQERSSRIYIQEQSQQQHHPATSKDFIIIIIMMVVIIVINHKSRVGCGCRILHEWEMRRQLR